MNHFNNIWEEMKMDQMKKQVGPSSVNLLELSFIPLLTDLVSSFFYFYNYTLIQILLYLSQKI